MELDCSVVSGKTVAKAMRARGLAGCAARAWRTTTLPEPDPDNIPVDRIKRDFDQGRLDAVWVGDCLTALGNTGAVEAAIGDYPSPTLILDGIDVATGRPIDDRVCCRLDLPSREQILVAL